MSARTMPETTPAEATPAPTVLDAATLARYGADGYIVAPNALDADLLARMTETTRRLFKQSGGLRTSDSHHDIAPGHTPARPALRRISSPTEIDPVYTEAIFQSIAGDIAADLVGGAVKFYHAKINFKLPGEATTLIQWHQDWTHFPHTNTNLVAVSLPMTPRTAANGAIRFVKGSHAMGPLSVWKDDQYVFTCEDGVDTEALRNATCVECGPGDVLAHHGLAVHGSPANGTDEVGMTLTIQYAAADAFAYTAPVIASRDMGRMVRGEPARFARLEAGMVELPPDFSKGYGSLYASQDEAQ